MKLLIMDRSGHTTLEFSPEQKAEAEAKFTALIEEGRTAATRKAGETDYKVIRDPGQMQDETMFMTQRQAG